MSRVCQARWGKLGESTETGESGLSGEMGEMGKLGESTEMGESGLSGEMGEMGKLGESTETGESDEMGERRIRRDYQGAWENKEILSALHPQSSTFPSQCFTPSTQCLPLTALYTLNPAPHPLSSLLLSAQTLPEISILYIRICKPFVYQMKPRIYMPTRHLRCVTVNSILKVDNCLPNFRAI